MNKLNKLFTLLIVTVAMTQMASALPSNTFEPVEVTITSWEDSPAVVLHLGQELNVHFQIDSWYMKPLEEKVEKDDTWAYALFGYKPLTKLYPTPASEASEARRLFVEDTSYFSYKANHIGIESLSYYSSVQRVNGNYCSSVQIGNGKSGVNAPYHEVTVTVTVQ